MLPESPASLHTSMMRFTPSRRLLPTVSRARDALAAGQSQRHAYATLTHLPRNTPSKPARYGQPHASTHPHLLSGNDLTVGIAAAEYEERRRKLMRRLPEGSRVICMGGTVRLMTQRE